MSSTSQRQRVRRGAGPKPYSRKDTPTKLAEGPSNSQEVAQAVSAPSPVIEDQPGFPTYAQYKHIETTYLNSLTPRRREKALINQAMFDRIWDVLTDPDTASETAQFRFWVRRMFKISSTQDTPFGRGLSDLSSGPVLLHDNLAVAIQEQFYELLCYCHGTTNHAGRDKTSALIRRHYSWVPKEIITQFIKACPRCILKKCGSLNPATLGKNSKLENRFKESETEAASSLMALRNLLNELSAQDAIDEANARKENWPHSGGPQEASAPSGSLFTSNSTSSMCSASSTSALEAFLLGPHPSLVSQSSSSRTTHGLQSYPMSREVSLFKGLPNGWQYFSTYSEAYAAFMDQKDRPVDASVEERRIKERRPRVPSLVPLRDANFRFADEAEDTDVTLLPLKTSRMASPDSLPPSLQAMCIFEPVDGDMPQIDPALLNLPGSPRSSTRPFAHSNSSDSDICRTGTTQPSLGIPSQLEPSTSTTRRPAPPPLDLSISSLQSMQAFLDYRHQGTPDSPLSPWVVAPGVSSSGSLDSCASSLTSFPMGAPSSLSPATGVFPTLPDESSEDRLDMGLADTTSGLNLGISVAVDENQR